MPSCEDLAASQWRPVFTITPPTFVTNTVTIMHTNPPASQLFYRLKANR